MVDIKQAQSKRDMKDFIAVPRLVQGSDPAFIARLNFEMKEHFSAKNPYFEHAQVAFFVAYDGKTPVGRISAQIDALAAQGLGHFGCVEARDEVVMHALLARAEDWLKSRGMKNIHGPYSLSINDEMGMLVEGFETPPYLMMNHAPDWYAAALEAAGYAKAKDVLAYHMETSNVFPPVMTRLAERTLAEDTVFERGIDMKNFEAELATIMDIFNDAWSENWGFLPMTAAEIAYAAENMKMIINPKTARIFYVEDQPVAMIVALPNLNEAARDLNGRLFPFGFLKLLWRLKWTGVRSARVLLMGIRKELQGGLLSSRLAAALIQCIQDHCLDAGYEAVEMSWVLEDNISMNRLIEAAAGQPYKRYRIYEKSLT